MLRSVRREKMSEIETFVRRNFISFVLRIPGNLLLRVRVSFL